MKKKTKLIALFSSMVVAATASAFILMQPSFIETRSEVENYSLTINPEDVTSSTESVSGQFTVKTEQLKNDVKFDFVNVKRVGDNLVILEGGYIANPYDSQIRSCMSATFYGTGDIFNYELGWEASGTTIEYPINGYLWADGTEANLEHWNPNYVKLAYRDQDVTISKIVIEFDSRCVVGEFPIVVKNGIMYRKFENSFVSVTGFAGSPFADVVIEDTIDDLPVTEIGERAFYYDTTIQSITFGSNLFKICSEAFTYASNLTSVTGLNNLTYVGYNSFKGVPITGSISFGSATTHIDNGSFMDTELTSVTFADTGNPYVGDGAFRSIETLESIHIGSEMNQFYEDFFQDESLEEITVGAGNTKYSAVENVLFDDVNKVVRSIAANRPQTSFIVPSGYVLKDYCAYGNQTLESLTLSDATYRIPDYSFCNSPKLETINFGTYGGVKIEYAFEGCTGLKSLTIPSNVNHVTQFAFSGCTNLETVVFEEGCTIIERGAFANCTKLKNVLLPTTLVKLGTEGGWTAGPDVFDGCTALDKICTRLTSGTYTGEDIISGWDGGRSLAYESALENLDGNHYRMVDGVPRIWGTASITFKVYRTDIGTGWAIYFLGSFNSWTANVDSRGAYVSDHWELTLDLVTYENYSFKGAVAKWDDASGLVYEAGDNHTFTPDDAAFEYVINWQY